MIGVIKNCSISTFMDDFVLLIFFIIQKVFLKSLEMQFFSVIFPIHFIGVGGLKRSREISLHLSSFVVFVPYR